MYSTTAQFAELQKRHLDALNALGSTLINATERLATLNLATTRALLQDAAEMTQDLLLSKDAQEPLAIASSLVQPTVEKLVSYSRSAYGIASGASADLSKFLEVQVTEGNRKLAELIETALKNAAPGSQASVSFLNSALAASNTAYDAVSKAAKRASELAESDLAAATAVATDVAKSKARKTP